MPRLLVLLQSAFSVWMLVDAIGRPRIPRYWYWVVLMPFGEWFYFFKYKIHDPDFAWLKAPFGSLLDRPASIKDLRHDAEETPSLANQVSLAQALHDADEYEEASKLFERALEIDSNSCDALYGLGVSKIGLGDDEGAVEQLRRLVAIDPRHHDYDGWARLAHALWKLERRPEAIEVLSRLVKQSPRLQHRMAYAHYLGLAEHRDEAQAQLATALREFEYAPKYVKRRQRGLAKKARERCFASCRRRLDAAGVVRLLEAKAIAALDHPNIVQVFSVEEAGGVHFFTMQPESKSGLATSGPCRSKMVANIQRRIS